VKKITLAIGGFVEIKPVDKFYSTKKNSQKSLKALNLLGCGGRIRTNPLRGFHKGLCPLLAAMGTIACHPRRCDPMLLILAIASHCRGGSSPATPLVQAALRPSGYESINKF